MMNGKPQSLTSKFKISYNLILNLLDIGDKKLVEFAKKSMVTGDLDAQMKDVYYKMTKLEGELDNLTSYIQNLRTPSQIIEEYDDLNKSKQNAVNKKRKDMERRIQQIKDEYRTVEQDTQSYQKVAIKKSEINDLENQYNGLNSYIQSGVDRVLSLLKSETFIEGDQLEDLSLPLIGKIASQIRESHCLVVAKLYETKVLDTLSVIQLIALFSCFTNISVQDDNKDVRPRSQDVHLNETVNKVKQMYDDYQNKELLYNISTGMDYNIHYDLLNYVEEWSNTENVEDCKRVLQKIGEEKGIFLGEFVKALLKINNISCELEKIAELTGNIAFLSKLKEIPNLTLKYVVTNQSLYV
jgi:hypothetical protein